MKVSLENIPHGETEVIIRYTQMTDKLRSLINLIASQDEKLLGQTEEGQRFVLVSEILYFESVDGRVYAYTAGEVLQVAQNLKELANLYPDSFFRCSKSMLINILRIAHFKSQAYGRIEAGLDNGENIIISRKYAGALRQILAEGVQDEDEVAENF
ncbi:LytTR family transcriptional regulator [Streptococcus chenjunshii]|uniref:LytTR family transcriptional regulator n=1 Tax=Streptococcus chenjunshii TaxID=2173853 RepID=A0A372KKA7_9STRE|nr:LytTR family DNA-binding domain-containing protein [Streptococcus chenjunshii]AXQ78129.1 LytTR family transcriptional regulator [Streptococcus chenjunshii]RFU50167.1 LytTR family transcriptional regulator [Streptococcus chenjunshii]RFU52344.1 LytTR family transcriptional regulator [Streptococcus chenjunshii]